MQSITYQFAPLRNDSSIVSLFEIFVASSWRLYFSYFLFAFLDNEIFFIFFSNLGLISRLAAKFLMKQQVKWMQIVQYWKNVF